MNLSKRLNMLEKAIDAQGPPDTGDDDPQWRRREAERALPVLRWTAVNQRWNNEPLPSDEELVEKQEARLQRFDTFKEWAALERFPDGMLAYFQREVEAMPAFTFTYC